MNIHKIQSHLHQSFLEEERKDAITGDLIQANDEVVFCGICKSAFLKDSWEYIGKKHCGQSKTLDSVPISVPLLLNVSLIKPYFITLTNSSISFEECNYLLSAFNPKDKKVTIVLEEAFQKGTEWYEELIKEAKLIENESSKNQQLQKIAGTKLSRNTIITQNSLTTLVIFLFLFFMLISFLSTISEKVLMGFLMLGGIYFGISKGRKMIPILDSSIKKRSIQTFLIQKTTSLGNQNSVTFGIFNHNLFFYFEKEQQGIFIEFTRISSIEIEYKSENYLYFTLKRSEQKAKEIKIPLIFSKKERITTFLLRLAKTKNEISNTSKVFLTDFPKDRVTFLKSKLIHYNEFVFTENYYSKPKKTPKNISPSIEELIVQAKEFQKLTESQKKSKERQNRNQHHQNQHQTQYKNYKRK